MVLFRKVLSNHLSSLEICRRFVGYRSLRLLGLQGSAQGQGERRDVFDMRQVDQVFVVRCMQRSRLIGVVVALTVIPELPFAGVCR